MGSVMHACFESVCVYVFPTPLGHDHTQQDWILIPAWYLKFINLEIQVLVWSPKQRWARLDGRRLKFCQSAAASH